MHHNSGIISWTVTEVPPPFLFNHQAKPFNVSSDEGGAPQQLDIGGHTHALQPWSVAFVEAVK